MIKGKTKIILTDVNTGKQEVHEDTNMVTNALKYLMGAVIGCGQNPNDDILPVATNALGGLMLFDGPLTEDVENIHFPSEAHLVGYAARNTNTSDHMRGSFNSAESGPSETGYTSTWDFGTSQANGTIKSVALTSEWAGNGPIRYRSISKLQKQPPIKSSEINTWYPIRYDGVYVYLLKITDDGTQGEIRRAYAPCKKFKVNDRSDTTYFSAETVTSFSTDYKTITVTNNRPESDKNYYREEERTLYADKYYSYIDGLDGYIYCFFGGTENAKDKSEQNLVYYFTLNYGDGSWKKSDPQSFSISDLPTWSYIFERRTGLDWQISYYATRFWDQNNLAFVGNTLYIRGGGKYINIIPLSNPLKKQSIRIFSDKVNDVIDCIIGDYSMPNGGVVFRTHRYNETGGDYWRFGVIYPDGVFKLTDLNADNYQGYFNSSYNLYVPPVRGHIGRVTHDTILNRGNAFGFEKNYLGTINNLSSPITKTASQTMKVIYTLTDVDDEESSAT